MKNTHRGPFIPSAIAIAVSFALGCAAAGAADAGAAKASAEPLRLEAQAGWLDDAAPDDEGLAGVAAVATETTDKRAAAPADRATITVAARRALSAHGQGSAKALARDATDADVRVHAAAQGAYIAQFPQRVDGIEVFGARTSVLLDRALNVRAITGGVAPAAAKNKAAASDFRRDAVSALRSAAGAVDGLLAASALRETGAGGGGAYRSFAFERSPTFVPIRPARIKPIWYPAERGLLAAYYAEISGVRPGDERPLARAVIVAADDGRVLSSNDLIRDYQPFAYRAFATPQGHPYNDPYGFTTPHPTGLPDGWRPTVLAPMNLVSLVNAGISTGDPWLPDGATETSGNNTDAYFDADIVGADGHCTGEGVGTDYNPAEGDLRAQVTSANTFDYAYDADDTLNDFLQCPSGQPALPIPTTSAQLNAKTVQMFYAGNWLHDYFYDLGFDEQAGNMQRDNYGRGGVGGDPLLMLSGGSHPYTALAEEGESPLISMGISRYSLTRRDTAAFDFAVLGHEWTHAVQARTSVRLTYTPQGGAIGEGSGDFIGQMLVLRGQDRNVYPGRPPFSGVYPASGAYDNLDYDVAFDDLPPAGSPGHPDNTYYHGVRRFPFSTDMSVNPLTFKNISIDQPLSPSPHAYDWLARSLVNAEVHTAGEIWSASMWECARNILAARPAARFEETRKRFLTDVVAGFKLFPPDLTFTEARNAILMAIRADDEADYRRCRAGFAKRGMGAGAVSADRYSPSLIGTVESFADRERALSVVGVKLVEVSGDGDGVLDRGEAGRLDVTVLNSGFSPLNRIRVRAEAAGGDFEFPSGRQSGETALAAGATTTLSIDVRVRSTQAAVELPLAVVARDQQRPAAHAREDATFQVNYDLVRDRLVDDVSAGATFPADWTSALGDGDAGDYCFLYCGLKWQRTSHLGEPAYVIREDTHIGFDTTLTGREFLVSATDPLRLTLRHDYLFDRAPGDPLDFPDTSGGFVQVAVDGGDWQPADAYLVSGPATFLGRSNGQRSDTLDFGTALAGHRVKFRMEGTAWRAWATSSAYWAISRIEIGGAAEPMFSRVVADVN